MAFSSVEQTAIAKSLILDQIVRVVLAQAKAGTTGPIVINGSHVAAVLRAAFGNVDTPPPPDVDVRSN